MNGKRHLDEAALAKLHHLGGDEFVLEMLGLFFDYVPGLLEQARAGGQQGDWRAVEFAVHSLKSSARGVGAERLQDLATRIELLAREHQSGALPALLRELEETYAQVKPLLEARRDELKKK